MKISSYHVNILMLAQIEGRVLEQGQGQRSGSNIRVEGKSIKITHAIKLTCSKTETTAKFMYTLVK